jgi:hypothetical protein
MDLRFLSAAGAHNRLLDQSWRIFTDVDPRPRRAHEDHAARLTQLQRRFRVLVYEDLLDGGGCWSMVVDQGLELVGQRCKPSRQRSVRLGLDLAVCKVSEAVALSFDQAPAGRAEAGIKAKNLQASLSSSSSGTS